MLSRSLACGLVLALMPAGASAQRDPCARVDCSGEGTCFEERGRAHCLCDDGFAVVGHACVEVDEEPDVLRMRQDPGAGQRAADLAMTQLERGRGQVGRRMEGLPIEPLGSYLEVDEWWCSDFVAWVYAAVGVPFTGGAAGGWLVTNNRAMRTWYVRRERWVPRYQLDSYEPVPGDFLRLRTDRGGHAAVVHHVEGTTLYAVEGNVSGTVELSRYYHYRDNPMIEGVGRLSDPNAAPEVAAGEDLEGVLPGALRLEGTVRDDGPDARLRVAWDMVSGPGRARFDDPLAAATEVTFDLPGTYRLRLYAHDGEHEAEDHVEVHVVRNEAPEVSARLVEVSAFHSRAELDSEVEDDGVPGGPLELSWSQVRGPGPATFDTPSEGSTGVVFPTPGTYLLRLEASDGASDARSDVEVVVPSWPSGCAAGRGAPSSWPALLGALLALTWRRRRRRLNRR